MLAILFIIVGSIIVGWNAADLYRIYRARDKGDK